jgi:hypothetical protein
MKNVNKKNTIGAKVLAGVLIGLLVLSAIALPLSIILPLVITA